MSVVDRYEFPPPAELSACPWAAYARLRDEEPVFRAEGGQYVISRHADIRAVLRDNVAFTHPSVSNHPVANVMEIDGSEHKRRRLMLAKLVAPRRLKDNEPNVRAQADQLIDQFIDRGSVELVSEFAVPFPAMVIPTMLGLDDHDAEWFEKWATGGLDGAAIDYVDERRSSAQASGWDYIYAYSRAALEQRIAEPRDDLLSELLDAQRETLGDVDLDALMADVGATIGGGIHTTAGLIGNTMALLMRNPDLLARVQADFTLVPRVLEESLRVDAPVQWQPRTVLQDVEVGGVPISAGSTVILLFGAGNRDEQVFSCPEDIDPMSPDRGKHLSFGFGPHTCFGAPLARLEGRVAFERLLSRLTNLRLADGEASIVPHEHPEHRNLTALHIEFTQA
jgi:cytochrome P450